MEWHKCSHKGRKDSRTKDEAATLETASEATYQTYFHATAITITTTTANVIICTATLLAKPWPLFSLCIAMMTSMWMPSPTITLDACAIKKSALT